jgi:hypothetical protein
MSGLQLHVPTCFYCVAQIRCLIYLWYTKLLQHFLISYAAGANTLVGTNDFVLSLRQQELHAFALSDANVFNWCTCTSSYQRSSREVQELHAAKMPPVT